MEHDVIEVCKSLMAAMLASGGADWNEARETADEIVDDCMTDPEYSEAFRKHLRAELEARHGTIPLDMGRFLIVTARQRH